jgi:polyketide cyclase/dehydrase/lipid transport protein
VEARRVIRATPDRIFSHLGRMDHFPRYGAPLWMTAEAGERRRAAHIVTLTGYLIGLPVESVQRVVLRPPHALEFKQIRGTLRALSGQCSLRAVEDGTEVGFRLDLDPGISMISDGAVQQFFVQFVEGFLDRIKMAAERRAPARKMGREATSESADLDADEEERAATNGAAGTAAAGEDFEESSLEAVHGAPHDAAAAPGGDSPAPPPGRSPSPSSPRTRGRRRRHRHRPRSSGSAAPNPPNSRLS